MSSGILISSERSTLSLNSSSISHLMLIAFIAFPPYSLCFLPPPFNTAILCRSPDSVSVSCHQSRHCVQLHSRTRGIQYHRTHRLLDNAPSCRPCSASSARLWNQRLQRAPGPLFQAAPVSRLSPFHTALPGTSSRKP